MLTVEFDISKLNQTDRKIYEAMTEYEKQQFQHTWCLIESQKQRLIQQKNASKERNQRTQKVLAERARKERTHRLIERGALLESMIEDPDQYSNEQIKDFLIKTITTGYALSILSNMRAENREEEDS